MEPLLAVLLACSFPRYQDKVDAALSEATRLSTGAAEAALGGLAGKEGRDGLPGHPGLAALLAVRQKGLGLRRSVYCAERGAHWVGVESSDGKVFKLPIGRDGGVDLSRLSEVKPTPTQRRRAFELGAGALALASMFGSPVPPVSSVGSQYAGAALDKDLRDALAPAPLALPAVPFDSYCSKRRCRSKSARATIDTDGWIADPALRELVSSPGFDRHHQSITSLAYAGRPDGDPSQYLDSTRVPYVVRHRDSPWRVGDLVVIEHEGRRLVAIVGDEGRQRHVNEVSYAAAVSLGINPDGNKGGTDSDEPIKVTRLAGFRLGAPKSEAEVLSALSAVQGWVDRP